VDTYEIKVLEFFTAEDVGKAIHPRLVEGQIEGGTLQGIGYGMMEELVMKDGAVLNPRMTNYIIPTSLDAPEIRTYLVEVPFSGGPHGAKGVGELPLDGAAPAVAAAIEMAAGVRVTEAPFTPEKLFRAWAR
jgi:CO/xanthine dehydrogenase Mo-binding subunit